MTAKLDIEYIEVRNFLSYGDYPTRLDVANLGPVLILGNNDEEGGSNGAGKSTLLTAFIWCLFGRTITNPSPGDKIVNWFTKKNCFVKIKTADGWEIIRTRNFDGHNELMLRKDGDDETQSTNTNAQKKINELFGLDYEIFTSSVFCGQFGKSFLEMTPAKRKETIERLLGLDRLNSLADAAKVQFKQVENRQEITRSKINVLQADVERQETRLSQNEKAVSRFENDRFQKLDIIATKISELNASMSKMHVPDIPKLKSRWEVANTILQKISKYKDQARESRIRLQLLESEIERTRESFEEYEGLSLNQLEKQHEEADKAEAKVVEISTAIVQVRTQLHCVDQDIARLENQINGWEQKTNTDCESCGQTIGPDHIEKHLKIARKELADFIEIRGKHQSASNRLQAAQKAFSKTQRPSLSIKEAKRHLAQIENLSKKEEEKEELASQCQRLETVVEQVAEKFENVKPDISLEEVGQIEALQKSLEQRKTDLVERQLEIKNEINPYNGIVRGLEETIGSIKSDMDGLEDEIQQLNTLFLHYKYIYRSYSDRRKIKSWLLSELIPFLNDRVQYYLDMLDITMQIKFSSTLNAETNKWGYEFCSGGERKRIDLAIMFGLYDLYMSIYGKQCNIMVLDEVDSRLDNKGVESFAEIVTDICTNDERPKPSTVFVISHKQELQSLFPSQITIKKEGDFSKIDQTVFSSD